MQQIIFEHLPHARPCSKWGKKSVLRQSKEKQKQVPNCAFRELTFCLGSSTIR